MTTDKTKDTGIEKEKPNDNMKLWNAVEKTNPAHAKDYNNGTFTGTAIKPLYSIQKATEQWGPMGAAWGAKELEHFIVDGVWFSKIELWYPQGKVEQWGATKFKYNTKPDSNGQVRVIIDDEAAKKAYTDAVTKCLSWLGFSADVHMGKFSDSKYVDELKKEFAPENAEKEKRATATFEADKQYLMDCKDVASLQVYFEAVKARKDTFHAEEYKELVTITANKNKQFKGEL